MNRAFSAEAAYGVVSEIDPEMLRQAIDLSGSISRWQEAALAMSDLDFVLRLNACAYDAAAQSFGRHLRGDENAADLPVGASAGDPHTNQIVQGFAQDQELDDPEMHAEMVTLEAARALGMGGGLTMSVGLESCPSCLDGIHESGMVSRLINTSTRQNVEQLGLIKEHGLYAPDIISHGREHHGKYGFEWLLFPHRDVQQASFELFRPFGRNKETKKVSFNHKDAAGMRVVSYLRAMQDFHLTDGPLPGEVSKERLKAITRNYGDVLHGFFRHVANAE